jgi:hypothetical protein
VNHSFSTSAKVKLADVDTNGRLVRDEERDLFEDRITKNVTFSTKNGARTPDEVILNAIGLAIQEFNKGGGTIGLQAAGTTGQASITIKNG